MNKLYTLTDCVAIEFKDTPEDIRAISDMTDEEIRVDYSTEQPILKIGTLEYNEGDYVVVTWCGIAKANKDHVKALLGKLCNHKINLCDNCMYHFADCSARQIEFGCGVGNDNVVLCDQYEARQ